MLESLMTLRCWEWHLIPRWLLRSIFARFPEQLLKGLISWESSDEYLMIDYSLRDAFGVLFCPFWGAHLKYIGSCNQWCQFFNWWCLSATLHIVHLRTICGSIMMGTHYANANLCTSLRLSVKDNGLSARPDTYKARGRIFETLYELRSSQLIS